MHDMHALYTRAWEQLATDRTTCPFLDRETTPILAFGAWHTARVVTAGLNPSEAEFRDPTGHPLPPERQRFLHWENGQLDEARLATAMARAEGYFVLGNSYDRWFRAYTPFLHTLGVSFAGGTACHTDYLSPFATTTGIGRVPTKVQRQLASFGLPLWRDILNIFPNLEIIIGHGQGWRMIPSLLNCEPWTPLSTPFDAKGGKTTIPRPYLLTTTATLESGRKCGIYWWRPNPDGMPLAWLNEHDKTVVGELVRDHARTSQ